MEQIPQRANKVKRTLNDKPFYEVVQADDKICLYNRQMGIFLVLNHKDSCQIIHVKIVSDQPFI